uniref:Contactin 1 n=1 Tax=Takifugu rubripes TaxID=31033 RepID=A0A674P8R2_TAKRU
MTYLDLISVAPCFSLADEATGYGPVFEEQPVETIYPEESPEAKITMNCRARASPPATYKWRKDNKDIDFSAESSHFSLMGGNLVISDPVKEQHAGNYCCLAANTFGTVISREASVHQLHTAPPPGSARGFCRTSGGLIGILSCLFLSVSAAELSFRWILNEFPTFIPLDKRRFVSQITGNLYISKVDSSDSGNYSCIASSSSISKSVFSNYIPLVPLSEPFPEWVEHITNTEKDLGSRYTMSCVASGKPEPQIRWMKNGELLDRDEMSFNSLTFEDSGMYQCVAENRHGVLYANAELRVFACAPTFEHNPLKRVLAPRNGRVVIECRPKAAPKPTFTWSKDTELLSNSTRVFIWEDGSLEILNVTRADEGRYTCFAENDRGKANSTGSLLVLESTKINLAPTNADIKAGENALMQCAALHDPSLDITFIWSLDDHVIDVQTDSQHYERRTFRLVSSNGALLIKNAQLKHAGRYTCMAQTPIDNATESAQLVVRGPPGAPGGVRVMNKTEKKVTLQWSRGADNHSPISKYSIQYRDAYSGDEWKKAATSPPEVEGNAETATVVDLFPWTEYEFRVFAANTLGTGEPSSPTAKEKTLDAVPVVAPSNIGGGGGTSRELTITWTPQHYYGSNFGYIVAFRPFDNKEWRKVMVADPLARSYIHKDLALPPLTKFQVKVKAFNSKGEGPFSLTAVIYSAQDAPSEAPSGFEGKALSATEAFVSWLPLPQDSIDGYQVKFWRNHEESEGGAQTVTASNTDTNTRLDGMKPNSNYLIEVRGYNTAGYGPPSERLQIRTKKAPPSQAPRIIGKRLKGQTINIAWENAQPLPDEAAIDGYKVLYRKQGQALGTLYTTSRLYIDLPLPAEGDYVVEVRAHTEGGDGAVAQIQITGNKGHLHRAFLPIIGALIWQKGDAPSSPCPSGSGGVMAARSLALILLALLCLNL